MVSEAEPEAWRGKPSQAKSGDKKLKKDSNPKANHKFPAVIRIISAILVITFIAQDIAWAYPDSNKNLAVTGLQNKDTLARLRAALIIELIEKRSALKDKLNELNLEDVLLWKKSTESQFKSVKFTPVRFDGKLVEVNLHLIEEDVIIRYFNPTLKVRSRIYPSSVAPTTTQIESIIVNPTLIREILKIVKTLPKSTPREVIIRAKKRAYAAKMVRKDLSVAGLESVSDSNGKAGPTYVGVLGLTRREFLHRSSGLIGGLYFAIVGGSRNGNTSKVPIEPQEEMVEEVWRQVPLRSETQARRGLLGGEGMQMVQSIAYAPSNPERAYLSSNTSQVWESKDGGKTWSMNHQGFYANGGLSVAVDPLNEDIVFVAGTIGYPIERYQPTDPLCGIFRKTGETWKLMKKTLYFSRETGDNGGDYFIFSPTRLDQGQTKTIYAGTYNEGFLKTTDAGDTWVSLGLKDINIYDIKANPKDASIIFIASTQGLYKYNDNDGLFSKIGAGLPDYPRTIAINPQSHNIIYAAVGKFGVYRSDDAGINFTKRSDGLPEGKEYTHIALSPANPDYLYVSINKNGTHIPNPFYSHDAGASWHTPETLDQGELALFAAEEKFFSAQIVPHPIDPRKALTAANGNARILMTEDAGKSWFWSGSGYTGARMGAGKASLAFGSNPQKMVFFLIDHGPVLTIDGGETFQILDVPSLGGRTTPVGAVSDAGLIVTAVGSWKKQILIISRDNGKNWEVIPATEDNYKFIAFHPQKQNIIYAQGFISEDAGKSWKRLSKKVYAVFRGNGDIVYSIKKLSSGKSIILRSNNRGKTWKFTYPELPIPINSINELDIDPNDPDRIYVATNFGLGIYDGKKWIKRAEESGLSKDYFGLVAIKSVAVDPKHPKVIYAGRWAPGKGQSNGVFRSIDHGLTWENIIYNLSDPITIWSIAVSPHDGTVYAGTSHGTWEFPPPYQNEKENGKTDLNAIRPLTLLSHSLPYLILAFIIRTWMYYLEAEKDVSKSDASKRQNSSDAAAPKTTRTVSSAKARTVPSGDISPMTRRNGPEADETITTSSIADAATVNVSDESQTSTTATAESHKAKIFSYIDFLKRAGTEIHRMPQGAQILLSENLFIRDGDRQELDAIGLALRPVLESGYIAILKPEEIRRKAINNKVTKDKLAIVLPRGDFDNEEIWNGADKETLLKASVLLLDDNDKLLGANYLYLECVIRLAKAIMASDKESVRLYYQLISGSVIADEALKLICDQDINNPAFLIDAILRLKPIDRITPNELHDYRIKMENFLIAA